MKRPAKRVDRFWERKRLDEFTQREWERLCDRCALCCRETETDARTGRTVALPVACRLLDVGRCRCRDYANRHERVPACVRLTPANVGTLRWLPTSCAYRRLAEGRGLPEWHPLMTGRRGSAHAAGFSVKDRVLPRSLPRNGRKGRRLKRRGRLGKP